MIQSLQNNSNYQQKKPVVLATFDGIGLTPPSEKNAVQLDSTPTFDRLFKGDLFSLTNVAPILCNLLDDGHDQSLVQF